MGNAFESPSVTPKSDNKSERKDTSLVQKSKSLDANTYLNRNPDAVFEDEGNNDGLNIRRGNEYHPSSDSYSSEEDAEKFKAAVEANMLASKNSRMSEKKILGKLANEAKVPRKVTLDVDSYLNKSHDTRPAASNENLIKRGYYAKLGIERSPTMTLPSQYYMPKSSLNHSIKAKRDEGMHLSSVKK